MNIRIISALLVYYVITFTALIIVSYKENLEKYRIYAKTSVSLGFVSMGLYAAKMCENIEFARCMIIGLFMCLIGDILLGIIIANGMKRYIKEGLLSFLFGHIMFISGIIKISSISKYNLIGLGISVVFVICFLPFISKSKVQIGKMKKFVIAYIFIVSSLFMTGLAAFLDTQIIMRTIFILMGTFLFLISDTCIFFLYYYRKHRKILQFMVSLSYYLAQMLLVFSLFP